MSLANPGPIRRIDAVRRIGGGATVLAWILLTAAAPIRTTAAEAPEPSAKHWSFQPVVRPEVPATGKRTSHPVDAFVRDALRRERLDPSPEADRTTRIRRLYDVVLGLPPTPSEIEAFRRDRSPKAWENLVDRVLEDPRYGERWARHWLDVARYSDGHGGFGDDRALPNAWRYRDWVVAAFNTDMPYDQFVTRQIAGDALKENPDPVATGFFVVGPTYRDDGGDPEAKAVFDAETLSDRVDTFSRAFLGLTAACARCHDHKFDPITIKDYYAIAGVFRNTGQREHPVSPKAEVEAFEAAQAAIREQDKRVHDFLHAAAKRLEKKPNEVEAVLEEESKRELAALRTQLEELKKSLLHQVFSGNL
jgi:hypothetical protein